MAQYFDEATKTWYCKFRYTDWTGKAKTTTRRGFRTKKEAKAAEARMKEEAESQPSITLAELAEVYLADLKKHRKESTYINAKRCLDKHVLTLVGSVRLKDITPNTIRHWQNELNDLAPATIRSLNGRFSAMLRYAVKFCGLRQNPFTVTGYTGKQSKRDGFWEPWQFRKAIQYMLPSDRLVVEVLFYSGMRIGELLALSPDDIDFKNNTISISKTLAFSTRKITAPKTSASNRVITMPAKIIKEIEWALSPLFNDLPDRIFPQSVSTLRLHLREAAREAGVPLIGLHGLRHSHASFLIKKNISLPALSRRLGHSTVAITLNVYSHFYKDDDKAIAKMLNEEIL